MKWSDEMQKDAKTSSNLVKSTIKFLHKFSNIPQVAIVTGSKTDHIVDSTRYYKETIKPCCTNNLIPSQEIILNLKSFRFVSMNIDGLKPLGNRIFW